MIAETLKSNKERILEHWALELKRAPASERHRKTSLRKIRANSDRVLNAIIALLESKDLPSHSERQAILGREASYLGELRQAQGFQLGDLVEEYVFLRRGMVKFLMEEAGGKAFEPFELEQVELALDAALKATVQTFHDVDREDLLELANIDSLTDLPNNSYFGLRLQQELARAIRYQHAISLLMIDIDDFKQFNDAHGHPSGDLALKNLARVVVSVLRTTDIAARYGGEEFAVILPETGAPGARVTGERVRRAVASHSLVGSDGRQYSLTVSVGCAACEGKPLTARELIEAADQAMYTAKNMGKNCCFVWLAKTGEASNNSDKASFV